MLKPAFLLWHGKIVSKETFIDDVNTNDSIVHYLEVFENYWDPQATWNPRKSGPTNPDKLRGALSINSITVTLKNKSLGSEKNNMIF